MKSKRNWAVPVLVLVGFGWLYAQEVAVQKIDLVRLDNRYRLMIHCSGRVRLVHKLSESPPVLSLYLRDARVQLEEARLRFDRGPVRRVEATLWRTYPHVVRIDVRLNGATEYEVHQKIAGLIFVDFSAPASEPPAAAHNGHLEGEVAGDSLRTSVPGTRPPHTTARFDRYPQTPLPEPLTNPARIWLDVHDAEIQNVLRLLAKQSGLNIVANQAVQGKVSVTLNGVTVREALELITRANGYDYLIAGQVILVKPREAFQLPELETRVYRLKYIDASNLKAILQQVVSSQARIQVFYYDFQPTGGAATSVGSVGTATGSGGAPPAATGGAVGALGALPGPAGASTTSGPARGKRSSTLLVTDTRENFPQVEAMIRALDVPTPQIMIEAKLLEVSPQDEEKLGIDWSKTVSAEVFREVILPSGQPFRYSAQVPLDGGNVSFGTLSVGEYSAVLDFLRSHTDTKLISNPRILTSDNQEAVISVGTNVPIPQITRGVGGQGDVVTFEYRDVAISLRVTPHVADDETITLHVNPVVEEIVGEVQAGESRAPITARRQVETVVNVKNNETVVIGGLIKEDVIDQVKKVWLLGDIPLIGNLFRHKEKTSKQSDMLIFITPRLIEND